ncbi:MAG TPA: pyridoxal-phosphate dependent enzyme [Salinivirgaceae bacterium]|nr:pyridoxal-phosphate dependent enzyme [Salinivirgaceae bacterium]
MNKFRFRCLSCDTIINSWKEWFQQNQSCPKCGNRFVYTEYNKNINEVKKSIADSTYTSPDFWRYFDFLPLHDKNNIITSGEGAIPVDRWKFLEDFARDKYNLQIEVYAYRNDLNGGTRTFKDVAGSMAASVLKENGINEYCIASTGNIANAYAHYLAKAGINLSVFIPEDALKANEAEVNSFGQRIYRVKGDYAQAKKVAAEYSQRFNILMSIGNIDPIRVEAKKTMVFEWLRLMKKMPTVYIQALSGGTGPIAIYKAFHDLEGTNLFDHLPRFYMIQPHRCAPMAHGFRKAQKENFPDGWLKNYPIYENPQTMVPTLATGNPTTYPIIADLVKKSEGEILEFSEDYIPQVARMVAYESMVRIGPASCIAVGGFFETLHHKKLKNGDVVLINIGEGTQRAPELMEQIIYTTKNIASVEETEVFQRASLRDFVWKPFKEFEKISIKENSHQ